MTAAEIVASFMEPKPQFDGGDGGWWSFIYEGNGTWKPVVNDRTESLDALHEVEARLTDDQQWLYIETIRKLANRGNLATWHYLHASAAQKLSALAQVLRPEVEKINE